MNEDIFEKSGRLRAQRNSFRALCWGIFLAAILCIGNTYGKDHKGRTFREDRVILLPKRGIGSQELEKFRPKNGRRILREHPGLGGIRVVQLAQGENLAEVLEEYRRSGLVEFAEPDYKLSAEVLPNDPQFAAGTLWGLNNTGQNGGVVGADIEAVAGWDTIHAASNVVVAVIDSGIRLTHEDLKANLWTNPGEIAGNGVDDDSNGIVDDIHGINAIFDSGDPSDDNGHGTHVAGIIGASGNNGKGVTGVAWQVQLMGLKFLDDLGNGDTSDAIQCIDYARRNGADIINASWGGGDYSSALYTAISNARNAGIVFVAAAGNDSSNNDLIPHYPSNYDLDNIVAVCGMNRSSTLDLGYSNYGSKSVDVGAPGTTIYSTWWTRDDAYTSLSGTSMAAPYVSGALALLKARFPAEAGRQLIERLYAGVEPLTTLSNRCATGGRLNLASAVGPSLAADFTVSASIAETPAVLSFTDTSYGAVSNYYWDFGDGSPVVTNANPTHLFVHSGEFEVLLKVVNGNGISSSKRRTVRIVPNYEFVPAEYAWIDPSQMQPISLTDNGYSAAIPIGFPVELFGEAVTSVHIGANGVIGTGTAGLTSTGNSALPNQNAPNLLICPYWDNLNPRSGGQVYVGTVGAAPNRRFVVSWVEVPRNSSSAKMTFQAVIEESSQEVIFQYVEVDPDGNRGGARGATIGMQNGSGEIGSLYTLNGVPHLLGNQTALRGRLLRTEPRTQSISGAAMADGTFTYSVQAEPGQTLLVETSVDLLNWVPLSTNVVPEGGTIRFTQPSNNLQNQFFRTREVID